MALSFTLANSGACLRAHTPTHTHVDSFVCFCFFSSPSTVSTQSQRLWDYQSPFVFRREPSWLGGGLRWEPSGLYSKQFPLRLPLSSPHCDRSYILWRKEELRFSVCVCVSKTLTNVGFLHFLVESSKDGWITGAIPHWLQYLKGLFIIIIMRIVKNSHNKVSDVELINSLSQSVNLNWTYRHN